MTDKLLLKDVFNGWAKVMAEGEYTWDYFTDKDINRVNEVLGDISLTQLKIEFEQLSNERPWLIDTSDKEWSPEIIFEVAERLTRRNEASYPALAALHNMNNSRYEYSAVFYPELYTEWFNHKYVNVD